MTDLIERLKACPGARHRKRLVDDKLLKEVIAALTPVEDEEVQRISMELEQARNWRSSPANKHARIFPEAIDLIEQLRREKAAAEASERSARGCNLCNWLERDICIEQKDKLQVRIDELFEDATAYRKLIETIKEQIGDIKSAPDSSRLTPEDALKLIGHPLVRRMK